jgi:Mn-dependent DtxR family transcriptional regulator
VSALLAQLGLGTETIEQEVEDIEHHLRPQTLAALSALVEYWQTHPAQLREFRRYQKSRAARR